MITASATVNPPHVPVLISQKYDQTSIMAAVAPVTSTGLRPVLSDRAAVPMIGPIITVYPIAVAVSTSDRPYPIDTAYVMTKMVPRDNMNRGATEASRPTGDWRGYRVSTVTKGVRPLADRAVAEVNSDDSVTPLRTQSPIPNVDHEHALAPEPVAEVAEDQPAERTHEIPDRKRSE
jgi:hypothetical protein